MNNLTITRAREEDIDTLIKWGNETPEIWLNDTFKWYPDRSMVKSLIHSDRSLFLVARSERIPVGMCLFHNLIVWGYCDTVFVDPSYRHQGIAMQLLQEAERLLKTEGVRLLALHAPANNVSAARLYQKLSFISGITVQFYEKNLG